MSDDDILGAQAPTPKNTDNASFAGDLRAVIAVVSYCAYAVRRRRKLAWMVFVITSVVGVGSALLAPKQYTTSFRVQTQRSYIIPSLVDSRSAITPKDDVPTEGIEEVFQSVEFLDRVVTATNLTKDWTKGRGPLGMLKDRIRAARGKTPSEEGLRTALRSMLLKRLGGEMNGSSIRVEVTWGDAELVARIAQACLDELLRQRREAEMVQIRDTIKIIEDRIVASKRRLKESAARLAMVVDEKESGVRQRLGDANRRLAAASQPDASEGGGGNLSKDARETQRSLRETKQRAAALDRVYKRQLAGAEQRLAALRETLGPGHPDYQRAVRELADASHPPAELSMLRNEESHLERRMSAAERQSGPAQRNAYGGVSAVPLSGAVYTELVGDPDVANLSGELRKTVQAHNTLIDRAEAAQARLSTAEAAFKYRYVVSQPPTVPTKPSGPTPLKRMLLGIIAGLMLALAMSVAVDVMSFRVIEAWQLESMLDIEVLGRVRHSR